MTTQEEDAPSRAFLSPAERRKQQLARREAMLAKVRDEAERAGARHEAPGAADDGKPQLTAGSPALLEKKLDASAYDRAVRRGPTLPPGTARLPAAAETSAAPAAAPALPYFSMPKLPEMPLLPKVEVPVLPEGLEPPALPGTGAPKSPSATAPPLDLGILKDKLLPAPKLESRCGRGL